MQPEVEIREAYLADVPFIFSTLLKSYRYASNFARKISNEVFFKYHHMFLDSCLKRPGSKVLIAHPKGEPDVILGYLLTEKTEDGLDIIHYTYIKKSFRQMGVARALWSKLEKKNYTITHYTVDADWISKKYDVTYNPYRL